MQIPDPSRRSRLRRTLIAGGVLAVILLGAVAAKVGPLLFEPSDYGHVVSIEQGADYREPALIAEGWRQPVAMQYRARPYEFQKNPSFCGPASAANLLRSLGVETSQAQVIDGTKYEPWFGVLLGGLTLDELADLLQQRTHRPVKILRDLSLAEFREHLRRANDPTRRYVVNFHRGPLFGRGHGHFSPVLAYIADHDLVLVGDVNEDYRPFLVSSERLWRATDTLDGSSGKKRGLIEVAAQ